MISLKAQVVNFTTRMQKNLPVYLESDVLDYFTAKADAKGIDLSAMLNQLLKNDITLIVSVK